MANLATRVAARLRTLFAPHGRPRAEQRQRRRALWLATYGIDVGPRRIHDMEVAR
ncbi:hypothetical protein ACH4CE_21490 [Streptomyces gelaticus]|uniref:hypothetical protein n=1 Tax=Streptomyces gelaticus TaxID=285446 RepID=UPI003789F980